MADPLLAGEVAMACSTHRWMGVNTKSREVELGPGAGGRFRSPLDRLRGVSVWLTGDPALAELVLRELGPDGRTLGPEVARARASGADDFGLVRFPFDPIAGSAGHQYLFQVACPRCPPGKAPKLVTVADERAPADLVLHDRLQRGRVAAFTPVFAGLAPAVPSSTQVSATREAPGRWEVTASGDAPSLVVVAESWFPGWSARVDGRPSPLLVADGAFLGVPVGPGRHAVSLEYGVRASAVLGRVATGAALAVCLVFLVWQPRRRREPGQGNGGRRAGRRPSVRRRRTAATARPAVPGRPTTAPTHNGGRVPLRGGATASRRGAGAASPPGTVSGSEGGGPPTTLSSGPSWPAPAVVLDDDGRDDATVVDER
jgi:hypothetical protein